MQQLPTPLAELLILILYLGSITFIAGAILQTIILKRNKVSLSLGAFIILLTRLLTLFSSLIIWKFWIFPFDIMFLFLFLPALLSELIFSLLILKLFKLTIFVRE